MNARTQSTTGAKTGKQFLDSLGDGREVWFKGRRIANIAEFEPFANPLTFATATGNIDVRSFGVTSGWDRWGKALGQIQVLDYRSPDDFIIRVGNLPGESLVLAKMSKPAI